MPAGSFCSIALRMLCSRWRCFERFAQLDGALLDQLLQFVVGAMRIVQGFAQLEHHADTCEQLASIDGLAEVVVGRRAGSRAGARPSSSPRR
jgi:hypothetical protein